MRTIYEAIDGTQFATAEQCQAYEAQPENLSRFIMGFWPDGRMVDPNVSLRYLIEDSMFLYVSGQSAKEEIRNIDYSVEGIDGEGLYFWDDDRMKYLPVSVLLDIWSHITEIQKSLVDLENQQKQS